MYNYYSGIDLAPVVLFVYNRPWHTKQTVSALQRNELSKRTNLFIFSDGPINNADCYNVKAVRDYLRTIFGFKTIKIIEQKKNIGLAGSVIAGVSEIINKYGRVIVLEDDLVTASGFLYYMNQALELFALDENVMQISGYMFDVNIEVEADVFFLPFTTSWGWATWKRSWDYFDPFMSGFEKLKTKRSLRYKFDLEGSYNYFRMLESQLNGKIDSWAIKWYLSVFMMEGLTLYPVQSLVKNIGFDGSGVHCNISSESQRLLDYKAIKNIHCSSLNINRSAFKQIICFLHSQLSFREKLFSIIRQIFLG